MSGSVLAMMISVSVFLGTVTLLALLWGLRTKQFDDEDKFLNAVKYDGVVDLRDAVMMEEKKKEAIEKKHASKKGD